MQPHQQTALSVIQYYEGFSETPYQDSEGIWTVGTGHTYWKGRPVTATYPTRVTRAEDTERTIAIMLLHESFLVTRVPNWVSLTNGQKACLISFAYNTGWSPGDEGFDTLNRYIVHRPIDVPHALKLYTNKGTLGLKRRRRAEGLIWYGKPWNEAVKQAEQENPTRQ